MKHQPYFCATYWDGWRVVFVEKVGRKLVTIRCPWTLDKATMALSEWRAIGRYTRPCRRMRLCQIDRTVRDYRSKIMKDGRRRRLNKDQKAAVAAMRAAIRRA